jgi:hypothetical protein
LKKLLHGCSGVETGQLLAEVGDKKKKKKKVMKRRKKTFGNREPFCGEVFHASPVQI